MDLTRHPAAAAWSPRAKARFLAGYTLSEPERDALMRPDWSGLLALGVLPNLVYRYYMMHGLAPELFPGAIAATR